MLNEDKIILMTHMASYEQNEGKKNMEIGNYFRGDYISMQVIKAVVRAAIAFAIVFALVIFYDFENLMQEIYKMDLLALSKKALVLFGLAVVAYGVIAYLIYSARYTRAKKSLKKYYENLKKLSSLYQ